MERYKDSRFNRVVSTLAVICAMKTIDALNSIDWFANVGKPLLAPPPKVVTVSSWHEAIDRCSTLEWENIRIEATNALMIHLRTVCQDVLRHWNDVVRGFRLELAASWERLRDKVECLGLPEIVEHCVQWDTLYVAACEYYACWNPPCFFEELLPLYCSGHFPCGWVGDWPEGSLQFF